MEKQQKKTSIVLSGGGARAAYQVGVLKAIAEMLPDDAHNPFDRSEEHTSELQSHWYISYAVFCLKKKKKQQNQ